MTGSPTSAPTSARTGRLSRFTRQASADLESFGSTVLYDEPATYRLVPAPDLSASEDAPAAAVSPDPPVDPLDVVDPVDRLDPFEPADRFERIEWLTPAPEHAVARVREPFVEAFRELAGPGSRALAAAAWDAWSSALLDGEGLDRACSRAESAVTGNRTGSRIGNRTAVPTLARLWLSPWQLRRAAWSASRRARDVS